MLDFLQALSQVVTPGTELSNIMLVTLRMALFSTAISMSIGTPLGVAIGFSHFRGKRLVLRLLNTLMGLPPVLAGLVVFFILSRSGPLGSLRLLYTTYAMVTAQVILITPVVCGLTASATAALVPKLHETMAGFGCPRPRELLYLLYENRAQIFSYIFVAFGRSIGEVGAVMLVGGNVQYKTRVMTTAIMLETNKGNFEMAVALGVVLLLFSFIINSVSLSLQERSERRNGRRSRKRVKMQGGAQ